MRLEGKRTAITGAGSGMGRATAERFVREGARVAVIDIDGDAAEATAADLGPGAIALVGDMASESDVDRVAGALEKAFDGLDVFFNNAGIPMAATPLEEVSLADWNRLLSVNLTAIFLAARRVAPMLRRAPAGGVFLITSSISGRRPRPGLSAYTASKGGAIALTTALAVELAPDIRVNGIAPLAAPTPMLGKFGFAQEGESPEEVQSRLAAAVPLQRLTQPEDIAAAAVYLASDEAAGITGITLNVDSGRHL
jgi:3-oxoacyl-[acyl-carrier protein] reductase